MANKARLPIYDFPLTTVNDTPGTFRVMTKELVTVDGKYKLKLADDGCYVFVRPKHQVGSSGYVWAGDQMRLRYEEPHEFVLNNEYSKEFTRVILCLKDTLSLQIFSNEVEIKVAR